MSFTNAQLAQKISDLIDYWSSFNTEYSDWLGGTVDGGPGSDGKYPLTNWAGAESLIDSPAKLADNVSGYVGLASASEAAAAASAAAASTSESNASTSASTATAQAVLADADRVAAELAEANALSSQNTATAQANLATDRVGYATEWAQAAFETPVSVAAGGDGSTDFSALHWATVAEGFAGSIDSNLYAQLAQNETITGSWTFGLDTSMAGGRINITQSGAEGIFEASLERLGFFTKSLAGTQTSRLQIGGGADVVNMSVGSSNLRVGGGDFIMYNNKFYSAENARIASTGAITAVSLAATGAVTGSNLNVSNWDTAYGWGDHAGVYEPVNANLIEAGTLTQADNFTYLNRNSANPTLQVAQVGAGDIVRFYKTGSLGSTVETSGFTVLNYGAAEVDVAGDAWTYRHLRAGVAQGGLFVDTIGQYWLNSNGSTVLKNPVGTKRLVTEDYMTFQQSAGGTAQLLQSTTSESGAGLNLPALRWWEADGTSVAGIRAYQNPGSTIQQLVLGTGWFSEKLTLASDDIHDMYGNLRMNEDGETITLRNTNHVYTDTLLNNWIRWEDSNGLDMAWIGFGSNSHNDLGLYNSISGNNIRLGTTGGGDILLTPAATGALEIRGSSYKTNPTGLRLGQYASTIGYVQAPAGGKVAIWNDNTGEIASFNDDSTTYFQNDIRVKGAIKGTPNNVTWASDNIHFATVVGGGGRNENGSSTTGYIRIKLPGSAGSSWMGGFDLHGYEYNSRGGWGVRISAYEYTGTSWYNESIEILYGSPPFDTCYWGGNSVTNEKYVLLGSSGMTMAYPQLMISNYIAGYSNQARHIESDWTVDISASTPSNWVTDTFLRVGGNIRWGDLQSGKNNGGQITINTTSGTPSGGNDGDIHFVY